MLHNISASLVSRWPCCPLILGGFWCELRHLRDWRSVLRGRVRHIGVLLSRLLRVGLCRWWIMLLSAGRCFLSGRIAALTVLAAQNAASRPVARHVTQVTDVRPPCPFFVDLVVSFTVYHHGVFIVPRWRTLVLVALVLSTADFLLSGRGIRPVSASAFAVTCATTKPAAATAATEAPRTTIMSVTIIGGGTAMALLCFLFALFLYLVPFLALVFAQLILGTCVIDKL